MDKHFLKKLVIKNVRGIKETELDDLSDINLLLGENNGGKTSILEAISLLRCQGAYELFQVSFRGNGMSEFDSLRYLFRNHSPSLSVRAETYNGGFLELDAKYRLYNAIFSKEVFLENGEEKSIMSRIIDRSGYDGKEMRAIKLEVTKNGKTEVKDYLEADFQFGRVRRSLRPKASETSGSITYISPSQHFEPFINLTAKVLASDSYKRLTIELLKLFDPSIEDLLINIDPISQDRGLYIKTNGEDPLPVTLFGDGMKKALTIACYIAIANGGILLIDEVETSLHHSLYSNLFRFLIKASKQFGVQLFITTHSEEVIETFFDATEEEPERMRVYTIRKDEQGVSVRGLNSLKAKELVESGIEVRG